MNNITCYLRLSATLMLLLFSVKVKAQVSSYNFSQSGGTYTEITGGTVVATATGTSGAASLDDVVYNLPAGTIPFNFVFNNITYTGCNISTNGFITFGTTAPAVSGTTTGYVPLSATTAYAGAASALGRNLNAYFFSGNAAQTGQIRYQTLGTSPGRTFVIQFKNFKTFNTSGTTFGPVLNFQIRLSEGTNSISFVYNFSGAFALSTAQVGLRGSTNAFPQNINNRLVASASNTWLTSSAGTANTSTCEFSGSLLPPFGLTYVWSPASCPAPQNLFATNITQTSAELTWTTTGGNGTFSVEYGPAGFSQGSGTLINNTVSGTLISGLTANTNYQFYVRQSCGVNGTSAWVGPYSFSTGGPAEDCGTATLVSVATSQATCSFTSVSSGISANGPSAICSDANGNTPNDDRWFRFVAPTGGDQLIITTTAGTVNDWVMEVWSGCPGSGQVIKCADDVNGFMPEIALCQNEYTAGQTYYIRLWTYSASVTGTANLCVYRTTACPLAPVNDECISATRLIVNPPLSCPGSALTFSTANATPNTDAATCDAGTKRDVWFVFNTGNVGDIRMTISPVTATSLKAQLLFECGGFELNCYSPANGNYTFTGLNPQADYIIRVWSDSAAAGTFNICLSDNCSNPTASWGGNQTACSGQATSLPVNFNGVPPYSFTYRNDATNQTFTVNTSQNPYNLPLTLTATTSFTLLNMSDAACSGTASGTATVTVVTAQTVTLSPFQAVCEGAPPQALTGGSPAGGVYSGTGVSNGVFDPAFGTQLITYTVTFAPGCTGSASQNFTVNPIPAVVLNTLPSTCQTAAPFTLTGGTPTGGNYSGPGVSNNIFNPSVAGLGLKIITYTYTSPAGCTGSDTSTITVITCTTCTNPPTANAGIDRTSCPGASVTMAGSIGGGATSSTWTTLGTGTFSPNNTSLTALYTPSAADVSAGLVRIILTTNDPDGNGPCVAARDTLVITFLSNPSVSAITGSTTVCTGQTGRVYSVTNQSGYTYNWTVPAGVSITAGQGTNSITTSWSSSAVSGNVSVVATNSCGSVTATLAVAVSSAPSTPSVSGPALACVPQSALVYTIAAQSGATYTWTVPSGVTITAGAGTNSITTSWSGAASAGNVSVVVGNSCGTATGSLAVSVSTLPSTPVISGSTQVCSGATGITYTVSAQSGVSYSWTVPGNVTITTGQGTNSITTAWSASAVSGNVSVTVSNSCGTVSGALGVTVSSVPAVPSISGAGQVCQNTSGVVYSVSAQTGVSYSWTIPTGVTITSGQGTNSITTTWGSTAVAGNVTAVVSNSCGSQTATRAVTVLTAPAAPTISGATQVCQGATGITYSVSAQSGVTYTWSVPSGTTITSGQGTNSITTTWSSSAAGGAISISVANSCSTRTASLNVTTLLLPVVPVVTGVSAVCPGATGVTFSIPAQTGVTYSWTVPAGVTITAGQGSTSISTTWSSGAVSGNVVVSLTNSCGSVNATKSVTVNSAPTTPVISGPISACNGLTGVVYSVVAQSGVTYAWTVPAGVSITAGQGSNSITTSWGSTAVTGNVGVTLSNSCGSSSATLNVTVTNGLVIGSITGQTPICRPASGLVYSVNNQAGTTYTWTVPTGVTITSGQGTNAITTSWSSTAVTGTISVSASGACGAASANLSVTVRTALPTTPGTVAGNTSACRGDVARFTISRVATADYYVWTPPPGATINGSTSPFTTPDTFVVVTFLSNFVSDTLRVRSGNCVGLSTSTRTKAISLRTTVPSTPGVLTGQSSGLCGIASVTYAVPSAVSGAMSYTWRIKLTGALINGQPSPVTVNSSQLSVVVTYPTGWTGSDTLFVRANNGCGSSTERSLRVTARPGQPGVITGPTPVCVNAINQVYTAGASTGATSYTWTIPSGITLVSGQGTASVTLNFNATAATRTLSVVGNNSCGASLTARTFSVTSQLCPRTADSDELSSVRIYPNPASELLNVEFVSSADEYIRITVSDVSGRVVLDERRTVSEGANKLNLNLTGLSGGAYLLNMQSSTGITNARIIIER